MRNTADKKKLKDIINLMSKKYDMTISQYNESYLASSLDKRLSTLSMNSIKNYLDFISENKKEAKNFFNTLLNGYSKFFRNTLTFSLLEHLVLPSILDEKERSQNEEIRIWSAACSAGQEAYSVAILLKELSVAREKTVKFRIFGTDISKNSLALAIKGSYNFISVNNIPLKYIQKYFTIEGNNYTVSSKLKEHIDFSSYDLLDAKSICPPPSIYGEFDIIILSNLLYYYRPKIQQTIINKLLRGLPKGKYLITGKTEKSIIEATGRFSLVLEPAPVFRKTK